MTWNEFFVAQLDAEAPRTRRVLERVPQGRDDWTPHEKSMPLGRLSMLVARMPSWFSLIVDRDDLDLGAGNIDQRPLRTAAELVQAHEESVAAARKALGGVDEAHLLKHWRLLVGGRVVSDQPRRVVVRDTFTHLAHHRAQLGVYLRLNDIAVPLVYGPSADDQTFA